MRPLRRAEITLLLEVGVGSKSDVQVRSKFARADDYRAFGLRDRDFLRRALVDQGLDEGQCEQRQNRGQHH